MVFSDGAILLDSPEVPYRSILRRAAIVILDATGSNILIRGRIGGAQQDAEINLDSNRDWDIDSPSHCSMEKRGTGYG